MAPLRLFIAALLMAIALAETAAAEFIQSGQVYYVKHLGGRQTCPSKVELLGYLNQTCSAGAQSTANYGNTVGPILRSAAAGKQWKQFKFTRVGRTPEGDDLVTIKTAYPAKFGKPLCQGNMVVEKKNACISEPLAKNVHIHPNQPDVWRLTMVKGRTGIYTITAYSRKAPCLRYLGGSSKCTDKYVQLYAKDDGSGLQRWVITAVNPRPSPSPSKVKPPPVAPLAKSPPPVSPSPSASPSPEASPSPVPVPVPIPVPVPVPTPHPPPPTSIDVPGRPSIATASAESPTTATITWTRPASDGGSPITAYRVACVSTGGTAVGPQTFPAGSTSTGVGGFTGLQPETTYTSTVVAVNAVGFSSASFPSNQFTTGAEGTADAATDVAGTSTPSSPTTATITWTAPIDDGGNPITAYDVTCTSNPGNVAVGPQTFTSNVCTGASCSTQLDGFTGLTAGDVYTCVVVAINSAGPSPISAPSNPFTAGGAVPSPPPHGGAVPSPPPPPGGALPSPPPPPQSSAPGAPIIGTVTGVTNSAATISWTDPANIGNPPATFFVRCVSSGAGCNASPVVSSTSVAGGVQQATVTGLTAGSDLDCYAVASNPVSDVCSASFTVLRAPAAPSAPIQTAITSSTWTAGWTDGSPAGAPAEQIIIRCVAIGAACTATPAIESTPVARGVQQATVTLLQGGTQYDCFTVAFNGIGGDVCSAASTLMTTPQLWTSRSTAADESWNSVAWGGPVGSQLFVAVSQTGTNNRVMTSADGITWTSRVSAVDNDWRFVTWGGPVGAELFVAVASTGTGDGVMTSPDGVTWTSRVPAADNLWRSVAWGGPANAQLFVAVSTSGTNDRVMTSPDGLTWTSRVSPADLSWKGVTWGGPVGAELFVAVAFSGVGNRVMTSPDGLTWTLGASAADNSWQQVVWGGPANSKKFVAVSQTGTLNRIMTSPDGLQWATQTTPVDNAWLSITWGGPLNAEKFVAVSQDGTGNRVMISFDGVTWVTQTPAADEQWRAVTWGGPSGAEKFVAAGVTGPGARVMTCPS